MDRMLYVAMSGAKETMISQAANANNLANLNTTGFQADLNQFRSMPVFGPGYPTRVYAMDERHQIDFRRGRLQSTGGDLKTDANGILTNGAGRPVLGNNGPIALPPDAKVEIGSDGTITIKPQGAQADALAVVDRVKLVKPAAADLRKGEDGLLRLAAGGEAPADPGVEVVRGTLEGSNVNAVDALVTLIDLARRFEMQVKMMESSRETDTSAASILRPA